MRRDATSNFFSSFLLSLLIFLLIISEIHARKLQQVVCSSVCGDIKNISYLFRLKGDPTGCGNPDFELSCQNDKTILEILSGKYYVKRILHAEHIISVVDVKFVKGNVHGLHEESTSIENQRSVCIALELINELATCCFKWIKSC
ncbi:hypothetical protein JRO89_XS05G0249100 [Xanthoceras sorbifolium]|uniref:Wall-associated receptor kinase galacturonan-binding domain-containing protein n=1 Tax=Xanthoceras sorbifolium TaxID=99658 RepID=A0ABQ8I3E9_9ROSI|nr:hypothetical protein JRO89_XS05G0249100 [Xanthoceras sorbifolium]